MTSENQAVWALNRLSIFGSAQGGAYREHYSDIAAILGADVSTKLVARTTDWCRTGESGIRILTGNAGTGKTAVAEAFCRAAGTALPRADSLEEVAPGKWLIKDLSGLPTIQSRVEALGAAINLSTHTQALVCANEGVLRDALNGLHHASAVLTDLVDRALRQGAARSGNALVINLNRQRPTGPAVWDEIVLYLVREELWTPCDGCPVNSTGCPHQANATALRNPDVRQSLRTLVRLACGEAVPTVREVLAILSWAITGSMSCEDVKTAARDSGAAAFTSKHSYFARILGHGLDHETIERSPLLVGMRSAGLGDMADIEVDEWLRDSSSAPETVAALAGQPAAQNPVGGPRDDLAGTASPLDRIKTKVGTMTFHRLGEIIATSEDVSKVEAGLDALTDPEEPALQLWRRRVFFEASASLGGERPAVKRLCAFRFLGDLLELAEKVASGVDTILELTEIVKGLNFLVTGFSSANEGLVVPDPSCLFARNPGSFRPARPSLVHSQVDVDRLSLRVPDMGLVVEELDVDRIELQLVVDNRSEVTLNISPRMHEAIREAALFQGPVGHGIAEMTDLRSFYGRLAAEAEGVSRLRVADPIAEPPALITITLPRFSNV
jgi:hypothetical protein